MIKNAATFLGVGLGLGYTSYESVSHLSQAFQAPLEFSHHFSFYFLNGCFYDLISIAAERGKIFSAQREFWQF